MEIKKTFKKVASLLLSIALFVSFVPMGSYMTSAENSLEIPEIDGNMEDLDIIENKQDTTLTGNSEEEPADFPHLTEVPEGYIGIYTKEDLNAVRNNLSGNYILMNDIEFTNADFAEGGDFYNSGYGWLPIGNEDSPFIGILDGNGFVIENLYINRTEYYIGLFGYIKEATIKNLGIQDCEIISSAKNIGTVSGCAKDSDIVNCYNTGNITIPEYPNYQIYVGGISGYTANSTLIKCYNNGGIIVEVDISYGMYIGGITGYVKNSTINTCYNIGNISVDFLIFSPSRIGNDSIGGISGSIEDSTITKCYNSGEISATCNMPNIEISGISGNGSNSTISECYNTGSLIVVFCGISGFSTSGIISRCSNTNISKCYNTGNISITIKRPNAWSGRSVHLSGIAGYTEKSNIEDCYNAGNITVVYSDVDFAFANFINLGGISGKGWDGSITNCYNVGEIDFSYSDQFDYIGGIAGYTACDLSNCYSQNCQVIGIGRESTKNVKVCTDEEMKKQETFVGFDFTNVWTFDNSNKYPYPILRPTLNNDCTYGDINGDSKINLDDVVMLLRHVSKSQEITDPKLLEACNIVEDGVINLDDVIRLLRYVSKAIPSLK